MSSFCFSFLHDIVSHEDFRSLDGECQKTLSLIETNLLVSFFFENSFINVNFLFRTTRFHRLNNSSKRSNRWKVNWVQISSRLSTGNWLVDLLVINRHKFVLICSSGFVLSISFCLETYSTWNRLKNSSCFSYLCKYSSSSSSSCCCRAIRE